ncbi:hypothetical protein Asi02nite_37050 [Asanoa siamensis]|uniref:UvrD-like helicase ATP-binding domain-containing protein n=2 Tax=Asanoa siamensis TaxID=926357 RepID=A0ABQ4CSD7_9ACTN|nr:hypothetical protein Asi02nite_37050 [Asanoa siamensis]
MCRPHARLYRVDPAVAPLTSPAIDSALTPALLPSPEPTIADWTDPAIRLAPDAGAGMGPSSGAPAPGLVADQHVPAAVPGFRPRSQDDLAPSGEMARIRANLAALRTLRAIQADQRPATAEEQSVLGRWSGWGAVPAALDPDNEKFAWVRETLGEFLDERELAAARRTVINAHYTDLALVQAVWDGMARLGFAGGQVLEPGCGAGNFIAAAPDAAEITGVELDPTTAAIAAALHPRARVLAESFADTRVTTGSFDAVVGNVPFGDVRLHDKRDNLGNHSIHNHFILKALRATRPGGLVAVITSAYTMDAANPGARREMQQMGDLVGAVRLPSKAHARAAGTDALTDVLVFRRREADRSAAPFDWEYTNPLDVDGTTVRINSYFTDHPERILGRIVVGDGLYRRDEVAVSGDPATAPFQLRDALAQIAEQASDTDLTMSPGSSAPVEVRAAAQLPDSVTRPDGYLRANDDGTFSRLDDGAWESYAPAKTQSAELRALIGLRDTAVSLLEAEAASLDDTPQIDRLRGLLNYRYDVYQARFGPINRFTDSPRRRKDKDTGKMVPALDEETGEQLMNRKRPPQGGFRHDPFAPVVRALEVFNEETQTGEKADIFRQRVVSPRPPRLGADTPADALAICLDEYGEVRLATVAWLLGVDEDEARRALGTLVYDDPATNRLEPAAAYLSGDVKTKLATARNAADEDERYAVNVQALTDVVPPDLTAGEISDTGAVKMGAPWIGDEYVQQFLQEILEDPTVKVEHGGGGMWTVHSDNNNSVLARSTWGTDRRSAAEIAQHILEQREFVIKDTVSRNPKRTVVNLDAVMAATEKAVEMRERFADWVWEDPTRAATLVARYNDIFQRYVLRNYDDLKLSLPGLAHAFKPDAHQVAGVARIIHEPAVGLYHAVGAGKTATMIMGAMELRRLGLVRKPVVVVPNQLLDQWTREFLRLYPQAKILAASTEDLEKDRRRLMVARMATGDWDAVILTESAFEMLPMSAEAEQAYIDEQMAQLDAQISEARENGQELTLKRLETKKANREQRLEERLDNDKDAGIWWELTGIDYIFRDESHRDKNLRTVSNVPGMSIKGSQRATQMDMKLGWLRDHNPRWGTRATGTPLANSIVEMYTEFRFLRPDLMEQQGIIDVDSWLATYAEGKVIIEVTPDGGGLRNKTRLDFVNLDKLVTSLHVFADVKTKDDLNLARPPLALRADGQRLPEMVVVPPSDALLEKVAELVDRAAKLKGKRPEKGDDNILKIVAEGSAAALDLRLVGLTTDEIQKLDVAADRVAGYYHANKDRIYLGPDGEPHPNPGALQQVFCDLGTPSKKDPTRWTAYGALRQKLVDRGVPREAIRFIHEAEDDRARAELFASCRDGRTAVLISSTEKGGTGVNAQDRMLVLHHLDTPYRPCDLEQREGRIDRRGNQNEEIRIERYVTERSLDAFKWQKVAYKATLAERVLTGRAGPRTEDIGDVTLSYEEMKAASTGNPLLVDHAKAKVELTRLDRLERGYHRSQSQLRWTITKNRQDIVISRATITEVDAAIERRVDTRGDAFAITVRGTRYTKRGEANERLRNVLGLVLADPRSRSGPAVEIGEISGFAITATVTKIVVGDGRKELIHYEDAVYLQLTDVPSSGMNITQDALKKGDIVARLENRLGRLEAVRSDAEANITRYEAEIRRAEDDLAKPFRHAAALDEARARFRQLDIEVVAFAAASEAEANSAPGDDSDDDSDGEEQASEEPAEDAGRAYGPGVGARGSAVYGRGGGPGTSPGPRHQPTAPRTGPGMDRSGENASHANTEAAASAPPSLPQVLADPVLTDADREWITEKLDQVVTNQQVVDAARANAYDNFALVVKTHLDDLMMDAVDSGMTDLGRLYFASPSDDAPFRPAFLATAGRALYDRVRATPPTAPAADTRATPASAPPAGEIRAEHSGAPSDPQPTAASESVPVGRAAARPTPPQTSAPALEETHRRRRGHPFYPPAKLAATIPPLYATEKLADGDKVVHLHYFGGSNDFWLVEYDPATGEGFGYSCVGGDTDMAEWGYIDLPELERINKGLLIIERDLHWTPRPARELNLPGWRADTEPTLTPADEPADAPEESTPTPEAPPPAPRTEHNADAVAADGREPAMDAEPTRVSDGPVETAAPVVEEPATGPAVHTFATTIEAYDDTNSQRREDIRDGDVLVIESEGVVGFVLAAWPVAVTVERGELHKTDGPAREHEGGRYAASVDLAAEAAREKGFALDPAVIPPAVAVEPATPVEPPAPGDLAAESVMPGDEAEPSPPSPTPTWVDQIKIKVGPPTVVTGTTGHPREEGLRGLLKQHRFQYRGGQWRYTGRWADRDAAVADVQRWLAARAKTESGAVKLATAAKFPPTAQQQRIIDAYLAGQNIVVQALAGTGKTSTLQMLAAARPARIAYIAFNRPIADEAAAKFPGNVVADTSHGFARAGLRTSPLRNKVARVNQGARWPEDWARILDIRDIPQGDDVVEAESQAHMVMATIKNFRESAAGTLGPQHLPGNLREPGAGPLGDRILEYARRAWADITDPDGELLFEHDDYLKIWALGNPRMPYEVIFFDEAQDINDVLRKVIQDQPVPTVVVGDSNQSIYGFRGAIDALSRWPGDITLPLTQSWRFGPQIAAVGNDFLRLLKSPYLLTGNPGMTSTVGFVDQPDAVLARTNAGAVAAVFDAFDDGRQVALAGGGREIRDIAKAAQNLQNGRRTTHPELSRFPDWDAVQEYVENDENAQSLRAFVRLIDRRGAAQLIQMAGDLVPEEATRADGTPAYDVIVSTVHKSKGREWPRVRIAEDFPAPEEDQSTGKVRLPDPEELRLAYVAATRARETVELGGLSWIRDLPPELTDALSKRPARREVHTVPATTTSQGPESNPLAAAAAPIVQASESDVLDPQPANAPRPSPAAPAAAATQESLFDSSAEARLLQRVAARMPANPVTRTDDNQPAVLLTAVATGTYGQVHGVDGNGQPITGEGYVLDAKPWRGGIRGRGDDRAVVVRLADLPDGPEATTVQTDVDGRLIVLQPPEGKPAGEAEPWTRMPQEQQILAARSVLGLAVQVIDGPHNELWRVEGCPEQIGGEVAWWLFGGRYGSWEGRARPVFQQRRIDEAIAAGRLAADWSASAAQSTAEHESQATEPSAALADDAGTEASLTNEPTAPDEEVSAARQARLAKALDDFGPRYTSTTTKGYLGDGSVVRYVIDGHIEERVSEAERRWMKEYLDAHREILTATPLRPEDLDARDRAASDSLAERAARAVEEGRFEEALNIIDEAEPLYSHVDEWPAYRIWVTEAAAAAEQSDEPTLEAPGVGEPASDGPDNDEPPAVPVAPPLVELVAPTEAVAGMTTMQRYAASTLAQAQTPYSRPESRLSVYWQIPASEVAGLPDEVRNGLLADLQGIMASGEPRQRSAARRQLDRWTGVDAGHSEAQAEALASAGSTSHRKDSARVDAYGRMSAAEYAALEPVHRDAIEADLQAIADSGATRTIPHNRTSMGTTIRGVTANHVHAAKVILGRITAGPKPFTSNASMVGKGVFATNLNPGDRVVLSGREVTVDRVGLDGKVYLRGGRTLPERSHKLAEAGPDPVAPPAASQRDQPANQAGETNPHSDGPAEQPDHGDRNPEEPNGEPVELTAREQAIIRNAVADHAAGYYGGPLALPRSDVPRHIADGHLEELEAVHGRDLIWEAVAAVIDSDTTVLHRTHDEREQRRLGRQAQAEDFSRQALAAFKQEDYDQAMALAEQGEMIDPLYRPSRSERRPNGMSWTDIRSAISRRRGGQPQPPAPGLEHPALADAPAAPATPSRLARLDTATAVPSGPVTPARQLGAHSSCASTAVGRSGPNV